MKTYSIFAIYFREQCLYVGYSSNVPKYLKDLRDRNNYEAKKIKEDTSVSLLAFLLFYSDNYSDCLTLPLDTDLDLKHAIKIKKDYILRLNPLFNE